MAKNDDEASEVTPNDDDESKNDEDGSTKQKGLSLSKPLLIKISIGVAVVLILAGAGYFFLASSDEELNAEETALVDEGASDLENAGSEKMSDEQDAASELPEDTSVEDGEQVELNIELPDLSGDGTTESSDALEDAESSDAVEDTESSDAVEDTVASDAVEDTVASDAVEDTVASDAVEDTVASDAVEDTVASDAVEDTVASDTVEDTVASDAENVEPALNQLDVPKTDEQIAAEVQAELALQRKKEADALAAKRKAERYNHVFEEEVRPYPWTRKSKSQLIPEPKWGEFERAE